MIVNAALAFLTLTGTAVADIINCPDDSRCDPADTCSGLTPTCCGSAGNDTINGDGSAADRDIIYAGDGFDTIFGNAGNDVICGGPNGDTIDGELGQDEIHGGLGYDDIDGGDGDDFIWGDGAGDRIWGGDGDDTIHAGDGADEVWGRSGADDIYGGNHADLLCGGFGEDDIFGGEADDDICGGNDIDYMYGEEGDDVLNGNLCTTADDGDGHVDHNYGGELAEISGDTCFGDDFVYESNQEYEGSILDASTSADFGCQLINRPW